MEGGGSVPRACVLQPAVVILKTPKAHHHWSRPAWLTAYKQEIWTQTMDGEDPVMNKAEIRTVLSQAKNCPLLSAIHQGYEQALPPAQTKLSLLTP